MSSPCCPPGSEPALAATYKPRGNTVEKNGLKLYHIGSGASAVIVISDVFGYDGGRNLLIADQFADAGFQVIAPDFFRGNPITDQFVKEKGFGAEFGAWAKQFPFEQMSADLDVAIATLKENGATKFGMIGFCWGSWVSLKASASGKFSASALYHPSLGIEGFFSQTSWVDLAKAAKCPQLVAPAGNDPANFKQGGDVIEALKSLPFGSDVELHEFPNVSHGWMPRGDLTQEHVAESVKKGMEYAISFFKKHL
eukprot:TRINITY_DN4558_c0_g1_i1.p1 TRINITY_DN4558_c0_g1~~TRINITY_DN4558_c0_g1_i1.p1  ORF type:complete len:253 (-),score=72.37 TRINITY_DN4558_c0_g1_i1:98-856(-)